MSDSPQHFHMHAFKVSSILVHMIGTYPCTLFLKRRCVSEVQVQICPTLPSIKPQHSTRTAACLMGLDWTCSVCHIQEVLTLSLHIAGSVALNALKPSRLPWVVSARRGLLVCRLFGAELPGNFICIVQIILLYFELRICQSMTLAKHLHSF